MEAIEINTIKNEAVKQTHLSELWVYIFNYLLLCARFGQQWDREVMLGEKM